MLCVHSLYGLFIKKKDEVCLGRHRDAKRKRIAELQKKTKED